MQRAKGGVVSLLRTPKRKRGVAVPPAVTALYREKLLRKLSPERRQTYQRIQNLRKEIGTIDFDVVQELRNLRNAKTFGTRANGLPIDILPVCDPDQFDHLIWLESENNAPIAGNAK